MHQTKGVDQSRFMDGNRKYNSTEGYSKMSSTGYTSVRNAFPNTLVFTGILFECMFVGKNSVK